MPDGALDPSFDGDGKARFGFGAEGFASYGMLLDASGRLVLAGMRYEASGTPSSRQFFAIARIVMTAEAAPSVSVGDPSNVTATSALFSGLVIRTRLLPWLGSSHGTSPAFAGVLTAFVGSVGSGTAPTPVNASITGLTPGTTYYWRLAATNAVGSASATGTPFTTLLPAPTVKTDAASEITASQARLNGTVNPNGAATSYRFRYGRTADLALAQATPSEHAGSGTASRPADTQR